VRYLGKVFVLLSVLVASAPACRQATATTVITNSPARGSVVSLNNGDAQSYFVQLFEQKTGLDALSVWSITNDFAESDRALTGTTNASQGFFTNNANGSGCAYHTGGDTGVVTMSSGASGAGFCDWSLSVGGANKHVPNARQKRWFAAYLVAPAHAPAAASRVSFGLYANTTMIGIGYGAADTTWHYTRAVNNVTDVADTGVAIDSAGTKYVWNFLYNDGQNVRQITDVRSGSADTIIEPSGNLPDVPGYFYGWNEGTSSTDIINFDAYVVGTER
jgi:hypothetical protein